LQATREGKGGNLLLRLHPFPGGGGGLVGEWRGGLVVTRAVEVIVAVFLAHASAETPDALWFYRCVVLP
jgi:hypothetical protein